MNHRIFTASVCSQRLIFPLLILPLEATSASRLSVRDKKRGYLHVSSCQHYITSTSDLDAEYFRP